MGKAIGLGLGGAAVLLGATSCAVPEHRAVTRAPVRVTDARELVRRLVPDLSDRAIAVLPEQAAIVPQADALVGPAPFLAQAASDDDAARARACLTAAVYYEARSEPEDGQRAVAQVVLNRVRDRAFPHSVCGVVYQGVGSGKGCQFSFACDGSTLRPRDPVSWARSEQVAIAALGGDVMAAVGSATFYHNFTVLPWWSRSLTRLGAIGHHIFYRWPGAVERALGMGAAYAGVEPGAPGAPARVEAGVAMASASGFGVTVHRGGGPVTPDDTDGPVTMPARLDSGVRVHRGEQAPNVENSETPAAVGA